MLGVAISLIVIVAVAAWGVALWSALLYRRTPERALVMAMPVILAGLALVALVLVVVLQCRALGSTDQIKLVDRSEGRVAAVELSRSAQTRYFDLGVDLPPNPRPLLM